MWVSLVWRRREKQEVVRAVAKQLPEVVSQALVGFVGRGHPVGFINDYEVPMHLAQAGQNVGLLCEVERRDNALALQPLVDAELVADVLTFMTRNLVSNFSLSSRLALVDFSPSAEA